MISLSRLRVVFIAALLTALSACGGGGASSEGGIGGSGISLGIMQEQNQANNTAKVNGVTFDTTNTMYSEEGASATAANVQNGMVVVVQGEIDAGGLTGTADSIAYADILEGPITAKTATTITAMGQTILVDGSTIYSGTGVSDLADLLVGNVIEVSGFFTADGDIYATYVELTGNLNHEIKGVITAVNPGTNFNIGNLLVNWINTTGLNPGDLVKAEGLMVGLTNTLNAFSVDSLSQNLDVADADDAEVEGLVTTACSPATAPCSFMLGFITVQVDGATDIDGGVLADIQPGVRIEVEGELINNEIFADEIEFKDSVEIMSNVATTDGVNTLTMEFGAIDVPVIYNANITELDGFPGGTTFADIAAGAHLKIRARKAGSDIIATRIENSAGNTDLVLQGPVDAAANPNITILGVMLDTTGLDYFDQNDMPILLQDDFFNLVDTTSIVKAKGDITNMDVITWREIEIEDL